MAAPQLTIMQGDALEKLRELPDESVHCVITSPPYWGLRDYSKCKCGLKRTIDTTSFQDGSHEGGPQTNYRETEPNPNCPICKGTGILKGVESYQLGLEKTPEEYVSHLVEIFREVRRVLRYDGIVWLNLGDSYYGSWGNSGSRNGGQRPTNVDGYNRKGWDDHTIRPAASYDHPTLKPKDQCLIPHRVAIALQADGWWVRQTVIWSKNNPMPESCRDRCTSSHEYIFHLTKSAKYFYDQEAIRESSNWDGQSGTKNYRHGLNERIDAGMNAGGPNPAGRNKRSVWTMSTKPYPEAHFATFPEKIPIRCILAGTSERGCCSKCGAPWERITEKKDIGLRGKMPDGWDTAPGPRGSIHRTGREKGKPNNPILVTQTIGWQATCKCGIEETIPCTVLDPFAGSGTTGKAARDLGRSSILIELNPEYIKLIKERTKYALKAVDSSVFEAKA